MIKFNKGSVTNPNTMITKDIIVKSGSPNKIRDIVIGGGMALAGIVYLTVTAFKHGADKMEEAELQALSDADLI